MKSKKTGFTHVIRVFVSRNDINGNIYSYARITSAKHNTHVFVKLNYPENLSRVYKVLGTNLDNYYQETTRGLPIREVRQVIRRKDCVYIDDFTKEWAKENYLL